MSKPKIRYAQRTQVEMHMSSLDELISDDHKVREIWAYVEQMDLSVLEDSIRSKQGVAGAPAFDPRTLMCLWLYATVEGIGSARCLSRLCQEHLVYRWITGGEVINYHTLSSFRVDCGKILDDLLVASVATLADEGFLDLESMTVAVDGMRVRAAAGRDTMRRRSSLEKSLSKARQYVESLKESDPPSDLSARQVASRTHVARERTQRLEHALEVMKEQESHAPRSDRKPREPRVSTTDPEAAMLRMANGGVDPAHNIQFSVDTTTRIITNVEVPYMSSDTGTLAKMMENHEHRHSHLPTYVLADQGFFKYADIADVERRGCAVLMPDLYPNAKTRRRGTSNCEHITRWRNRMNTEAAKKLYRQRPSTVEWANACARAQGLRQLNVRGRHKARIIGL
jgi:transposase